MFSRSARTHWREKIWAIKAELLTSAHYDNDDDDDNDDYEFGSEREERGSKFDVIRHSCEM